MPTAQLIQMIRRQYRLPWRGTHGVVHWARVLENGVRLAEVTGAKLNVVRFFAVFHDCQRFNEGHDPHHGQRGAEFAGTLRGAAFQMTKEEFALLQTACLYHTAGRTAGDETVQTCWDADRLDLGRVGIKPDSRYLCTEAAKDSQVIARAYQRSIEGFVPDIVTARWGPY